ncbi:MAG TPA: hypothetical protein VFB13_03835 [Reyranella sp.]|jgi:hypothetical protein|nr:hypothetical protein [Reyranella sp.]
MAGGLSLDSEDRSQQQSLLYLLVDAIAFWLRSPLTFWIVGLPIAGLSAGVAWALDADQTLAQFRNHWGWDFLFALIYAMFLDRWMKASLLDGATPCDETDNLRRSIVSPRFLGLATAFFLLALAMAELAPRYIEIDVVAWSAGAALVALYLPSLSAAEPLSLRQAFAVGRSRQIPLFLLIAGAIALSRLAGAGFAHLAAAYAPDARWTPAALAALQRAIDCLLLAVVGHVLAALFRDLTDWRQPEPDDHPYRDLGRARRKIPAG